MNGNIYENADKDTIDIAKAREAEQTEPAEEKVFDIKSAKKAFNRISLALFVVSVTTLLLSLLAGLFLPRTISDEPWFAYLFTFAAMYVVAFPLGYLIVRKMPADTCCKDLPNTMTPSTFMRLFISALCLMYVGNIIGVIFDTVYSTLKYFFRERPVESLSDTLGLDAFWLQIVFVAVLAPIIEELVFRKMIIDRTKRFGYAPAIIFSGVLFGLFHGNFGQFFYATLLGFLLGYIYARTGKIINTILMHAAINIYGGVIPICIFSLMDVERLDGIMLIEDPELYLDSLTAFLGDNILPLMLYGLHAVVFFALAVTGFVFLIRDRKRYAVGLDKASPPMPAGKTFSTLFLSVGFILFFCVMLFEFYLSL